MTNKNFLFYSLGRLISIIGSGIQQIAIPLYILDLTGSGTVMGTFVLVTNLPRLFVGPFSGVLGDRFNRKAIMISMDLARGGVILLLAFLAKTNALTITYLLMAQFVISAFDITFDPATQAMIGDIVHEENLTKANSIIQGINSFSYIVGPALGGILYGVFGIEFVFMLNGVSFVLSGISEYFIHYRQTTEKRKIDLKSTLADIKDGLRYVASTKGLLILIVFIMFSNFIVTALFSVVFPFYIREIVGFSGEQFGFLQTAWVAGILIGNILLGAYFHKRNAAKLFKTGILAQSFINLIFSMTTFPIAVHILGGHSWLYFWIIITLFGTIGIFNAFVNTPIYAWFQKTVPTQYRSRVFSVVAILAQLITPLGAFLFGIGLDHFEAHYLILAGNILNLIVILIFLSFKMTRLLAEKAG
jgi:MFS family permease